MKNLKSVLEGFDENLSKSIAEMFEYGGETKDFHQRIKTYFKSSLISLLEECVPEEREVIGMFGGAAITNTECKICGTPIISNTTAGGFCADCEKEWMNYYYNLCRQKLLDNIATITKL